MIVIALIGIAVGDELAIAVGDELAIAHPGDDATLGFTILNRCIRLIPIWIGVPGTVNNRKLVRTSMRIGLGQSARFLRSDRRAVDRQ